MTLNSVIVSVLF